MRGCLSKGKYHGGGTFYLNHRKEFLDVAGEWYLDEKTNELTLAVAVGEEPPVGLIAPVVKQLFSIEGTQTAPVSRVRLSAMTFKHAAPTCKCTNDLLLSFLCNLDRL